MKPEQQRIALAEACGWSFIREGQSIERNHHIGCVTWVAISTDGRKYEYRKGYQEIEYLTKEDACNDRTPDYLNDLNAMHEAEKVIYGNPNLPKKYTQQIKNAIRREAGVTKAQMDFDMCITATARQRAEAFLKTIGKWTTNPNKP